MATTESTLLVSNPLEGVRVLTFNRPSKRNALSRDLIREFLGELASASADDGVRVVVVSGGDSFFCAGADIKEIARLDSEGARRCRYLEDLCRGMQGFPKPLLAAVEGMALGGGFEVALMCDMIFAAENSRFGLPEVTIGLLPGAGGTQRVTNALGKYRAMQMILSGEPITATEAHTYGLVTKLFGQGQVLKGVLETASKLANLSASALSFAKEAVLRADALGRDEEFERQLYYNAFSSHDKNEGVQAFLQKRAPRWGHVEQGKSGE